MKKFFYVMAAAAALLLIFYVYIGGFTAPDVITSTSKTMYIAGQPFKGSIKDEALGEAFSKAGNILEDSMLIGVLGSVYYNNPENEGDSLIAFIGIVVPDKNVTLPEGYELRTIEGGRKVLRAEVNASYMVAPGKLYGALFEYAEQHKIELEKFYVEWFPEENKGVVEVPVKQ
ncbi:GyrI-like domain-containing protein [Pontibacter silvestris]|uniref:GyrI-like domain-containing protein n=1 Tax=Pontibacter silvestris TaxID=2305183 RepID=A0ABW4WVM1_9BACT|nr:GyrI-like domain-containing protein [Pontibacter silvestris]MCC9136638.1 GyrI-like domain-containing protein [Pontibacter silvestris]